MPPPNQNAVTTAQVNQIVQSAIASEAATRAGADAAEASRAQSVEGSLSARLTALETALADFQQPAPEPAPYPGPPPDPGTVPVPIGLPAAIILIPGATGTAYHYGKTFVDPTVPGNVINPAGPYAVGTQVVSNHYYGSRWYDGPYVIKNSNAALIEKKLLVPHNKAIANITPRWVELGGYGADGLPNRVQWQGPMDYGFPTYMGQTGDNGGIGPFPEWVSAYWATEDASLVGSLEAVAKWGMTCPIHVMEDTGLPVSLKQRPRFSTYDGQANSMISPDLRTPITGSTGAPLNLQWDDAHSPEFFYGAYIQTEDPNWLRELQLKAAFSWGKDMPRDPSDPVWGHIGNLQGREFGWVLRSLVNCIAATRYAESLGPLPAGCLPSQEYIDTMITPTMNWLKANIMTGTTPAHYQKLTAVWDNGSYAAWQIDFITIACGMGIYYGISELQPLYDWLNFQLIERLTGKNGWNTRYPTWYYITKTTDSWSTTFTEMVSEDPAMQRADDLSQLFPPALMNDYVDYVCWTGAAARMGALNGQADLVTLSPTFDAKIKASGIPVNWRQTIGGTVN